jgi:Zn-dependent M16 (insulinase) family peptidase
MGVGNMEKLDGLMFKIGGEYEGFLIEEVVPLPELRATAIRATHRKSGARILHLFTPSDNENCFAVTFPTPPPDDTGIPHILEHAVLGGSRKFPVRDPFFEMVKMSMATFINAMTSQTYTVYPVSSNVKKDFFNLAEVYLDAVFHPLLTDDIFRREGHHLTLENNADLSSPLKVSGIVYSEMKGASSTPERLMGELAECGLFPDTPLGKNSGGDPEQIPALTYEQFLHFHSELYHPSNGLFFIYGDIPTAEHLRFLAPVLNEFERRDVRVATPRQPRWTEPRCIEKNYPVGTNEDLAARAFFTLNWIVGDMLEPATVTDWKVLSTLLLGNEAAPLKKALIDSKLGADVFFSGAWSSAYEEEFHVGLKGSEAERADAFERVVLATLERLAVETFASDRIEAAFQQLAYETLEVKPNFPLFMLFAVDDSWPFNGDPLTFLRAKELLDACHARYASNPQMFNHLIRDGLLKNPHRLRVVLRPDREAQASADAAFAARMAEKRALFSNEQIVAIAKSAAALAAAQGVSNSPELLATLPQLKTSDLPAKPRHIPTQVGEVAGMTVLRNDVFSNGINYLEIDMDLAGLPVELYSWIPQFNEVLAKMGIVGQDFARIAERRAACTGGLWSRANACCHAVNPSENLRRYRFGFKTLDGQTENALELLGDLIFTVDPRDHGRLRDVMTQTRASYRTTLVNNGVGTARLQAVRGLSPAAAMEHLFVSPDALRFIEGLTGKFDLHADEIMQNVERIRDFLVSHASWTVSFTGSDTAFRTLTRTLESWALRRCHKPISDAVPPFQPYSIPPREGLAGPMKIAHCVKAMPAPHLTHPDMPLFKLGAYLAQFDYMLPEIRFKGNAYGANASYDDALGVFQLYSFRDPNIVETLSVFDGLRKYVAAQKWSQIDIDRAIIGSAKEVEAPIRPADATVKGLMRHIRGDSNERRETRYVATLRATSDSVKETMLRVLDANEPRSAVCVVSSREKLDEANRHLGDRQLTVSDILPSAVEGRNSVVFAFSDVSVEAS